jgi:putative membrane protein
MVPFCPKGRHPLMDMDIAWLKPLLLTLIYSAVGVGMFGLSFLVITKLTPFSIRKEIEEDQNVALAILIAAVIVGLSIIIAAAISG